MEYIFFRIQNFRNGFVHVARIDTSSSSFDSSSVQSVRTPLTWARFNELVFFAKVNEKSEKVGDENAAITYVCKLRRSSRV